jgi:hypothetical protein
MVTPMVLLSGGIAVGFLALWVTKRPPPDLTKPLRTENGSGVRILTSQRPSPDGYPIVAAVHGTAADGVINLYTRDGVYGGTLWSPRDCWAGWLHDRDDRDLSNLINAAAPVPAAPEPVGATLSRPPLEVWRPLATEPGGPVRILAQERIAGVGDCLVVLVRDRAVNVYTLDGSFVGTVVTDEEAQQGIAYLRSREFVTGHDMADLCYAERTAKPVPRTCPVLDLVATLHAQLSGDRRAGRPVRP